MSLDINKIYKDIADRDISKTPYRKSAIAEAYGNVIYQFIGPGKYFENTGPGDPKFGPGFITVSRKSKLSYEKAKELGYDTSALMIEPLV